MKAIHISRGNNMAGFIESMQTLENDPYFKKWKSENTYSFMSHGFRMFDEANAGEWHFGFYNKNDTITNFIVADKVVTKMDESDIFKHPDSQIKPIIKSDIMCDDNKALSLAKDFARKNYPKETIAKEIVLLQHLDDGQVYNITFLTMAMNTLNIRIDTRNGEIKGHKLTSIMDFRLNDAQDGKAQTL